MNRDDEVWYVRATPWRPRTWRQWLATLAFGAIVATLIVLAIAIAATFFVIAAAVAIVVGAYLYLRTLVSPRRRRQRSMRDITPYRDQFDA